MLSGQPIRGNVCILENDTKGTKMEHMAQCSICLKTFNHPFMGLINPNTIVRDLISNEVDSL